MMYENDGYWQRHTTLHLRADRTDCPDYQEFGPFVEGHICPSAEVGATPNSERIARALERIANALEKLTNA